MTEIDWYQQGQQFRFTLEPVHLPPLHLNAEQQQWLQGIAHAHQKENELLLLCDCDPQGSDFEVSLPPQPLLQFLQSHLPAQTALTVQLLTLCQQLQL